MKILIITSNFAPEPTGIALYSSDLAEILGEAGHEVTVLTGLPHYPWWKVPADFSAQKSLLRSSINYRILRSKHHIPRTLTSTSRIRFESSIFFQFLKKSRKLSKEEFDCVVAFMPTLASGLVATIFARRNKKSVGLIIQDLSGLGVAQSGLKATWIIATMAQGLEKHIVGRANSIVAVSKEIQAKCQEMLSPGSNPVELILNYPTRTVILTEMYSARKELGWDIDSFIVLHSGNMGLKQNLLNVVQASKLLPTDLAIKIVLIGNGNQEALITSEGVGVQNLEIIPLLDEKEHFLALCAADVLLINERGTQLEMSLPSKIYTYLQVGKPILASVPERGATRTYLESLAEFANPDDPQDLATTIVELYHNSRKRSELEKKARTFLEKEISPKKSRQNYLDWISSFRDLTNGNS